MSDSVRMFLSFGLALAAGGLGYWLVALTTSGWAGAVLVGTLTAGFGGWDWGALVIVFFISSSALSRFRAQSKQDIAANHWEKSERRDWGQVFANGGLVSLLALGSWIWPSDAAWAAAAGVLATVTGDTWATEVGVLSRSRPRMITTGRPVSAGTSGGVTLLGSAAALPGAALIGIAALGLRVVVRDEVQPSVLLAALLGGAAGVACDSLLGATLQAIRWCPQCMTQTERHQHSCGATTVHLRGWSWLDNDLVNALASIAGGLVAVLVA